jgi:ATP-dependent exoDNAse (exonuclease V) beta subunit
MKGKNWNPSNKYWGMSAAQIKQMWSKNGENVSSAGTNMHAYIELFMNNDKLPNGYTHADLFFEYNSKEIHDSEIENTLEWQYFLRFIGDHLHLKPYRTEWMIYHEDVKIAGSIDMIYENEDGTLSIYDWKRSKDIVKDPSFKKYASNPLIGHILDSNYWHYALQLNTYKKILEDKYGKTIKELFLVRLHPDTIEKTYELIPLPILTDEMTILFNERKQMFV